MVKHPPDLSAKRMASSTVPRSFSTELNATKMFSNGTM
jgi:hypothetical protein